MIELATSARSPLGEIAIFEGGPITELGTFIRCVVRGGKTEKSSNVRESGSDDCTTRGLPVIRSIFVSFPEIIHSLGLTGTAVAAAPAKL